jgi:hypothetical protein
MFIFPSLWVGYLNLQDTIYHPATTPKNYNVGKKQPFHCFKHLTRSLLPRGFDSPFGLGVAMQLRQCGLASLYGHAIKLRHGSDPSTGIINICIEDLDLHGPSVLFDLLTSSICISCRGHP